MTPIKFHGAGSEYFKIWIVNTLLTIITIGLYRPWAKVRSLRYFYGNTDLDNASFEYHATGKQLFPSYLIAIVILALYILLSKTNAALSGIFPIALVIALPWIVWRSLKFNFRMTSYRNVRFGFTGNLSSSYIAILAYPISLLIAGFIVIYFIFSAIPQPDNIKIILLLLIFACPAYIAIIKMVTSNFLINGSHFGQGKFLAKLEFRPFFFIMLKATGLGLLLAAISLIIVYGVGFNALSQTLQGMRGLGSRPSPATILSAFIIFYIVFILVGMYVFSYTTARQRQYILNSMQLDKSIRFQSTLAANKFFIIAFTNFLLLICTLGLAYPWTAIRLYRYSMESIHVHAEEGFDGFISQQSDNKGPLGEELGDAFDVDVAGIAL
ncbi:Inner membrane protein YjgN [Marinomonas spartinae]|uniref:Inner membrane protein YjgN n=1 Tax=Marinomonas spartinae TaxID=1792290 RepID=A0A1A8TG64_9GAMM|nr:YjgN family protein [Marinomonas spartinae]SBS32430.1 Inner membrane protein YjgN [Marinomonas spartinae]